MHIGMWEKLKEAGVSVVPVMGIVVLLHLTIAPLPEGQIARFIVGGALLILGLGIFLVGAELGMVPFGQRVGSSLTRRRSLPLLLVSAFAIGFAITIAEPDVQVLATQVQGVVPDLNKLTLLVMIAVGVGILLVIAMARVLLRVSLRRLLIFFYILVFIACAFVHPGFVGVAFDSGGATTGPITVPFIMALGLGVASAVKREGEDDDTSFGYVGLASIGPIAAVACLGMFSSIQFDKPAEGAVVETLSDAAVILEEMPRLAGELAQNLPPLAAAAVEAPVTLATPFFAEVPHVVKDIALALAPLGLIFVIFQLTLLKLPASQIRRMVLGLFYTAIGLVIFLVGVNGGFSPVGHSLGMKLGELWSGWVLLPVGFILGAVVVIAEPAVWVLTQQVEEVSGGSIKRPIMLAALSVSIALAVGLGMLRVVTGMSIWWLLVPGYALALGLTRICPPLFTAIAFDSGGVASGPMSTTFVLTLTLGAATAVGGDPVTDAFGMVAMIAMAPLITIQLLGLAFKVVEQRQARAHAAAPPEEAGAA